MNEQEQLRVLLRLQELLQKLELYWIVEQVQEYVREGKIVKKEIQMYKENDFESLSGIKAMGKKEFVTTEDYSVAEQLHLLLDAVETVANSTSAMRQEVTRFFSSEAQRTGVKENRIILSESPDKFISFAPDNNGNDDKNLPKLRALLNQIRQEIE